MPRITTSNSDALDFCRSCTPSKKEAHEKYSNLGDGPDDRGNCYCYDDEHPAYQDEDYRCECCNRYLTKRDD